MLSQEKINKILKKKNIIGIGYGFGEGKKANKEVYRIYVTKKLPEDELDPEDIAPKSIEGTETDVIEIGEIKALCLNFLKKLKPKETLDRTSRVRPIQGGVSIGNIKITAGTKGHEVIVSSFKEKEGVSGMLENGRYILTNAHVACADVRADVSKQETKCVQPGVYDGGKLQTDYIGDLKSHVVIQQNSPNYVDAALIKCNSIHDYSSTIYEIGIPRGIKQPEVGMRVKKSGRTTGLTFAQITDTKAIIKVSYGSFTATFYNQIVIQGSGFSAGGDSGSLVLTEDNYAVGLLFAGSTSTTIANNIFNVLKVFDAELVCESPKQNEIVFLVEKLNQSVKLYVSVYHKSDNTPVENSLISVCKDSTSVSSKYTNSSGKCDFELQPGKYIVKFSKDGYVPQEKEITLN